MQRKLLIGLVMLMTVLGNGCDQGSAADRVLSIESTGTVVGFTFIDLNGNDVYDASTDTRMTSLVVRLVPRGGGGTVATGTSNAQGTFALSSVPVGEYELRVDTTSVPDSLRIIKIDSTHVRLNAGDSVAVVVTVGFPTVTVSQARQLPAGRRVFITAATLSTPTTFGDSTLHVADSTGAIRATRVLSTNVAVGRKVRLLGTTAIQNGQPTLANATVTDLGAGTPPAAVQLSTDAAAHASGGQLDAALVKVSNAVIISSQTNAALDRVLTVNDGSGQLAVVIYRNSGIQLGSFIPGASLTATGLLVPSATAGIWELKPRTTADVSAAFTIAQVRQLPAGRSVIVEGIAWNSWFAFADSSVHITDSTGSLRALRIATTVLSGDLVRFTGTTSTLNGQPVLVNVAVTVLGPRTLPAARSLTTAVAATADSAKADAALISISGATIESATTVNGDYVMRVNDGSGPVDVVLDKIGFFDTTAFTVGRVVDVTGLLQTKAVGVWQLKPRDRGDIAAR